MGYVLSGSWFYLVCENVIGVLGHVSENMLEAYKHTGLRAKQEALGMARANVIAFPGQRPAQR
jgi:hypothetical protein